MPSADTNRYVVFVLYFLTHRLSKVMWQHNLTGVVTAIQFMCSGQRIILFGNIIKNSSISRNSLYIEYLLILE